MRDPDINITVDDDKTCSVRHHECAVKGLTPEQATAVKKLGEHAFRSGVWAHAAQIDTAIRAVKTQIS